MMNYGQFLDMVPELILVITLILVFFLDFFSRNEQRTYALQAAAGMLALVLVDLLLYRHSVACTSAIRQSWLSRLS